MTHCTNGSTDSTVGQKDWNRTGTGMKWWRKMWTKIRRRNGIAGWTVRKCSRVCISLCTTGQKLVFASRNPTLQSGTEYNLDLIDRDQHYHHGTTLVSPLATMCRHIHWDHRTNCCFVVRTLVVDNKAFSVSAPKIWNELPFSCQAASCVNAFKCNLKCQLYATAHADHYH